MTSSQNFDAENDLPSASVEPPLSTADNATVSALLWYSGRQQYRPGGRRITASAFRMAQPILCKCPYRNDRHLESGDGITRLSPHAQATI